MLEIDEVRRALRGREPARLAAGSLRRAAVAIVLGGGADSLELLLIERAKREGDPWSGQMAFPGGRLARGDATARAAAERETLEEVGLSLERAEFLGGLGELCGRLASPSDLAIAAFVFYEPAPGALAPNGEVSEAFWFPMRSLLDRERQVDFRVGTESGRLFPGVRVGEPAHQVVWGLTYRFLEALLSLLGQSFPARSGLPLHSRSDE
ncbi:MAG TPA: CoA pyrophosphatase [Myxococcota bacterium]|nr:CoA pyrophosphatase [Myxococcota bacterium]